MSMPDDDSPPLPKGVPHAVTQAIYRRLRHAPLIVGWEVYMVMCVILTHENLESLLLPSKLVESAVSSHFTAIDTCCVCISPLILVMALIAPFIVFVVDPPPSASVVMAAVFSLSALPHMAIGLWGMATLPVEGFMLTVWQGGLLLLAVGCITSNAQLVMHRDIFDCRACGYPIRATIEAGQKQCPECGSSIPTVTFELLDEEREFERRVASRSRNGADSARAVEWKPKSRTDRED